MNADREAEIRFWLRRTAERQQEPNPTYYCVTSDDPTDAETAFVEKFGTQPKETFTEFGLLWVGPVEG